MEGPFIQPVDFQSSLDLPMRWATQLVLTDFAFGLWLSGLFPAILNLATNAHISANATCGEKGPEMFCKLVEHVPGRPVRHAQCRVCDGNSTNPRGKYSFLFIETHL